MEYTSGSIFYANLYGAMGSEQEGKRPVVIIQNNIGNRYSPTVIVVPITSKVNLKANIPTHVFVPKYKRILDQDSIILAEQITTIDKQRLTEYKGTLDEELQLKLDLSLLISLGIDINKIVKYSDTFKKAKEYMEITDDDYTNLDILIIALVAYDNLQHSGNIFVSKKEVLDYMKMLITKFPKKEIWAMARGKIDNKLSSV